MYSVLMKLNTKILKIIFISNSKIKIYYNTIIFLFHYIEKTSGSTFKIP